jgi:hypothetical protein
MPFTAQGNAMTVEWSAVAESLRNTDLACSLHSKPPWQLSSDSHTEELCSKYSCFVLQKNVGHIPVDDQRVGKSGNGLDMYYKSLSPNRLSMLEFPLCQSQFHSASKYTKTTSLQTEQDGSNLNLYPARKVTFFKLGRDMSTIR